MQHRLISWTNAGLLLPLVLLASIHTGARAQQDPPAPLVPQTIEFNRDIRPILSDKCYACHGPGTQMATLRFDREEDAKKALRGDRFAIVAGDPGRSELIRRVSLTEPAGRMPQRGEPLNAREIAVLTRWIEQGAKWQKHWAFEVPARPAIPQPATTGWVRNPIDAFVLDRLEREGLEPSREADRTAWLRRVTLDLTGLPPTIPEIDAFLADGSANA